MRTFASTPVSLSGPAGATPLPTAEDVAGLVARHYGLQGALEPLAAERDRVYRLTTGESRFVVRLSEPNEPAGSLSLQNRALTTIARRDPSLPVPRLVRSRTGNAVQRAGLRATTWRMRLFTYLDGVPALRVPWTPLLLHNVGGMIARLGHALAAIAHHQPAFPLMWDLLAACSLAPLLPATKLAEQRQLLREVLADFAQHGLPRLLRLPRQALHNDVNPKNVLYRTVDDPTVVGIIDFGDVTLGPRVVELGVAVARFAAPGHALEHALRIVSGYAEHAALASAEIDAVFTIVRVRLAMRILIRNARLQREATAQPFDLEAVNEAYALLQEVSAHGESKFGAKLRQVVPAGR